MNSLLKVNIRKRRSQRLGLNCPQSPKKPCLDSEPLPSPPLGDWDKLPVEIIHEIFKRMTIIDLSKLCLLSKAMLECVEAYRLTRMAEKKFLLDLNVHTLRQTKNFPSDPIYQYFRLGIYMKRSSFLKSTSKRLKHISYYLLKVLMCKGICGDSKRCISFYCYGTFLHTVIAGWDDIECVRVLDYIHNNTPISNHVKKIFKSSPGTYSNLEVYVRHFYRRAFMDVLIKREDKAFWLNQILKPYPMVHQARLLQIFFLTLNSVSGIDFDAAVHERLDVPALSALGDALVLLHEYASWNDDSIISVIDEIIGLPNPWHPQNFAALLLSCGENIIIKVLVSKAINNRLSEIACIAHHLLVASVKAYQSIKKASKCIWSFVEYLKMAEKIYITTELISSFKSTVIHLIASEDEPFEEIEPVLEAMSQFAQDLLDLALNSNKTNPQNNSEFTLVSKADTTIVNPNIPLIEE